jgi:NADPH:quinone reductase-like Zn-dependent oxidoreductase
VTGASGGVGRFAVQLAADAGAHIVAAVGSTSKTEGLQDLGADEVIVGLEKVVEPVDIVVDNVGGATLVAAWDLLAPGGSLQSVGWASGERAEFRPYATIGAPKSLTSFLIGGDVGADLASLVSMVQEHRLAVDIGWRGSWTDIHAAADAMLGRSLRSKAILDLDTPDR